MTDTVMVIVLASGVCAKVVLCICSAKWQELGRKCF